MRILRRLLVQAVSSRPPAEYLVVPILILLVLALVGPALLSLREHARKQQKAARLEQLGVSLNNYHDTFQSFPASPTTKQQPPARRRESEPEPISPF